MKVLNIDDFLKNNGVKVVVKGKEYVINDIPFEVQEVLKADEPNMKKAVALMLKIDESELDGYGIVAMSKIVDLVYANLVEGVASQKEASKD